MGALEILYDIFFGRLDLRFKDGRNHYFYTASETERRAWIYWRAYEICRRRNNNTPELIAERDKNWEYYIHYRTRALGGEL